MKTRNLISLIIAAADLTRAVVGAVSGRKRRQATRADEPDGG